VKEKDIGHYTATDGWIIARGQARAKDEKVFKDGLVTNYELGIRHKNWNVTPVMFNVTVYRHESGIVIGVFAVARGVTNYT
jgi:hypothetical protein